MLLAAAVRIPTSVQTLTVGQTDTAARDLLAQQNVAKVWFDGRPTYGEEPLASYPPATYAVLWVLVGGLDQEAARWLWALLSLCALGLVSFVAVRVAGFERWPQRAMLAVLPFSIYGSAQSIWNGQLTPLVLAALGVCMLLIDSPRRYWWRDGLLAGCFLIALTKPSLSAPFFWVVLLRRGGQRASVLIVAGYVGLTALATSYQTGGATAVFSTWLERAQRGIVKGSSLNGYGSLSDLLGTLDLSAYSIYASLAALGACGLLVLLTRDRDLWLVIGVVAIVSRLWTYHRVYDDGVVLFALLSLARVAQQRPSQRRQLAFALVILLALWGASHAPVGQLYRSALWFHGFASAQLFVWCAALGYLLVLLCRPPRPASSE